MIVMNTKNGQLHLRYNADKNEVEIDAVNMTSSLIYLTADQARHLTQILMRLAEYADETHAVRERHENLINALKDWTQVDGGPVDENESQAEDEQAEMRSWNPADDEPEPLYTAFMGTKPADRTKTEGPWLTPRTWEMIIPRTNPEDLHGFPKMKKKARIKYNKRVDKEMNKIIKGKKK